MISSGTLLAGTMERSEVDLEDGNISCTRDVNLDNVLKED